MENTKNITLKLRNHTQGLVQAVADKFGTTISSQNGKKTPLAHIATDTTKWVWTHWGTIDLSEASKDWHQKFRSSRSTYSQLFCTKPSMPAKALWGKFIHLNILLIKK